jgi:F-type H+-transporting ATPase subunit alpha
MDDIPVEDVRRFESELLSFMSGNKSELLSQIKETKELPDTKLLDEAIQEFKKGFSPSA